MKSKLLLTLVILLSIIAGAMAQLPQQINYQAVVRDASGQPLHNGTTISVRFQVHDGSPGGAVVFQKLQHPVTNQFGLVTLSIGALNDLSSVSWGTGPKYLQVEVDPAGGVDYSDMGTSQLLSVPYALYAANGPQGATGSQGLAGAQGPQGTMGPQGNPGPQGATGNAGPQGQAGPEGAVGPQGLQGIQGIAGDNGTPGEKGDAGPAGPQGPQGIQGIPGVDGAQGIQGIQGATGAQGIAGVQGGQGEMGQQGPAGANGINGINGATGDQGPTGANGINGNDGATGPQGGVGPMGPQGPAGADGINGIDGTTGPQGPAGNDGAQGAQGPAGNDGINGIDGAQGPQGNVGPMGPQGLQGDTGFLQNGGDAGSTPYWDGYQWVTTGNNLYNTGSNIGIGTSNPSAALDVEGTGPVVKIVDGNQNTGYVLTSDSSGNATWQSPAASSNNLWTDGGGVIVTTQPYEKVSVTGSLDVNFLNLFENFSFQNGAQQGYVLTSHDAGGNAIWESPADLGMTGPQGAAGPTGPQGPAGSNGVHGVTGATGPQGPAGNDGAQGDVGPMGAQGPTGADGINGNDGEQGPQGDIGPMGPQGPTGNDGINGNDGAQGATGPQGPAGANGINGINGAPGAAGPIGPTGATGPNGLLANGSATGNTAYWNGSAWVTNSSNIFNNGSTISIGGTSNTISNNSIVVGHNTIANGNYSIGVGWYSTAHGDYSLAAGAAVVANGTVSTAIGSNSTADGDYSIAMGAAVNANGYVSTSIGNNSTAAGQYSTTIGGHCNSSGDYSTAMGNYASTNSQQGAFVVGDYSTSSNVNATGANNFSSRFAGGYNFYSDAGMTTANEMVFNTGNLGIGTNTPQAKLDVAGTTRTTNFKMTAGAAAGYVLQSDTSGNATWVSPASLSLTGATGATGSQGPAGNNGINGATGATGAQGPAGNDGAQGATGPQGPAGNDGVQGATGAQGLQGDTGFLQSGDSIGNTPYWNGQQWITTGNNLYNAGGNIGIGTQTPAASLDVEGSGPVMKIVDGTQANGYVLTSDSNGNAKWQAPAAGGFTLPYSDTLNAPAYMLNLTSTGEATPVVGTFSGTINNTGSATGVPAGILGNSTVANGAGVAGINFQGGIAPAQFNSFYQQDMGVLGLSDNIGVSGFGGQTGVSASGGNVGVYGVNSGVPSNFQITQYLYNAYGFENPENAGVWGNALGDPTDGGAAGNGNLFGVVGQSYQNNPSTANIGIYGEAANSALMQIGVMGVINSGYTQNGSSAEAPNAALMGIDNSGTPGNYAGYFKGAVGIVDGTQGANKVLTSDANGNASWQNPGASSSPWTLTTGYNIYANAIDTTLYYNAGGNVGIGTSTPAATLEVNGFAQIDNGLVVNGAYYGYISITGWGGAPVGVLGENGAGMGGAWVTQYLSRSATSGEGVGIWGNATGDAGEGMGVEQVNNIGVVGQAITNNTDNINVGVYGEAANSMFQQVGLMGVLNSGYSNGPDNAIGPNAAVMGIDNSGTTGNYAGYFQGQVAIADGSQNYGYVLTSDANGNASWQNISSNPTSLWIGDPYLVTTPYAQAQVALGTHLVQGDETLSVLGGANIDYLYTDNVAVNTSFVPPVMSSDAISTLATVNAPQIGSIVFNTDLQQLQVYTNSGWVSLVAAQ